MLVGLICSGLHTARLAFPVSVRALSIKSSAFIATLSFVYLILEQLENDLGTTYCCSVKPGGLN